MINAAAKTVEYDIRGQICPSTLLVALREINKDFAQLVSGSIALQFLTDNRDSLTTISMAAGNMGLNSSVEKDESGYRIRIFKQVAP